MEMMGGTGKKRNRLSSAFTRESQEAVRGRRERGRRPLVDRRWEGAEGVEYEDGLGCHWRAWPVAHYPHPQRPAWSHLLHSASTSNSADGPSPLLPSSASITC